jgi:secreted trypsin-like serine protease
MAGGVSAGPSAQRIVGGDVADPADWPSIAALYSGGRFFCGASVVAPNAVLTAAHCVTDPHSREPVLPRSLEIVTGRYDLNDTSAGQETDVRRIFVHPDWKPRIRHDVAVLRLKAPTSSPPALLPTKAEDRIETSAGSELRVAGWGATRSNGSQPSDVLLDVAVYSISNQDCRPYYPTFRPAEEVCAFGEEQPDGTFDDSCFGDSGGPLIARSPRGILLVGAVSYGPDNLCGIEKPGVYATTADNLGFIRNRAGIPRD